jgi:hypothetical protein
MSECTECREDVGAGDPHVDMCSRPVCSLCSFPDPRHASECTSLVNVLRLARIARAAEAAVMWTKRFDSGMCMHGLHNTDCRACSIEPPHFPVGIDEFCELESALIDAGMTPPWFASKKGPTEHKSVEQEKP